MSAGPREAETDPASSPPRRPRRSVRLLGALLLLAVGFLGGVVTDRVLAAAGPPAVGESAPLVGVLESAGDGTIAVRTADGALVALRTGPGTRVVGAVPRPPVPGTTVEVVGVRDADGALTASSVAVPAR